MITNFVRYILIKNPRLSIKDSIANLYKMANLLKSFLIEKPLLVVFYLIILVILFLSINIIYIYFFGYTVV